MVNISISILFYPKHDNFCSDHGSYAQQCRCSEVDVGNITSQVAKSCHKVLLGNQSKDKDLPLTEVLK